MRKTILLNDKLKKMAPVIAQIEAAAATYGGEFAFVVSSPGPEPTLESGAPNVVLVVEPQDADEETIAAFYCELMVRYGIHAFLPKCQLPVVWNNRTLFESLGVQVLLPGDNEALEIIDSKTRLYDALGPNLMPIPTYMEVLSAAQFRAACNLITSRHFMACYKPSTGIFGIGFFAIDDGTYKAQIPPSHQVKTLDQAIAHVAGLGPQIVMQYLPGPERGVDCLAENGKLIQCVVRRKTEDSRDYIEDNPKIVGYVSRLAERLNLSGLYHVQFRDADGISYLLEINPRMSGGITRSNMTGLVLPYWAIQLASGQANANQVPAPKTEFWVEYTRV